MIDATWLFLVVFLGNFLGYIASYWFVFYFWNSERDDD